MDILQDLEKRGLIHQTTDREGLEKHLAENQVTLYCGFDPTADSLHIGHLLPITMLKRFQKAGHKPIALVGGGTGMIGDPSGRTSERSLNEAHVVKGFSEKIKQQIAKLVEFDQGDNPVVARNNHDWLSNMTIIDFLRDAGKHFGINYMLAKESVSARIEQGITYTEFSYMILQSLDFLKLYEQENCTLQIGGSDQWGNITAGMELIRRSREQESDEIKVFGLTVPLITKADGTKFGKTAGGAVWLDPEKTSPYEFYQFWVNTDDRDVIKFLRYFTFISDEEMAELESEVKDQPEKRVAQRRLAEEMTKEVHSQEALEQAQKISAALFSGDIKQLTATEIKQGFKDVPTYKAAKNEIDLIELLVDASISSSKRQAREDISNGAVYINGERQQELGYVVSEEDRIGDMFTVIRRGKKKYFLIEFS
ncbi:tyrosine--tRNA ligase [Virgibacillus halodenitrificans]|uniref:Tyrosine--tRNA ligase n=1 Tax=Virgibacillus halodenitrificans TaxID=1482 RepID=A0ABR7VPQ6_VIRHA|nr:tyrosine--tRNA ligase [Virgibacillus halodenitrificans]MBD1223899.1 tyrosine--tRNA ligase [Virgibacillus halodenitrificans]MCG1027768.1 tyrosine--tRNA ligase [Virgibacillus halodenitrificans]MCJ0931778.1 tyrosine--tRNA ligase [Virgibacillus halodenitrificans]CDQ37023.1 Tyrosine--tRNA ligase 1 [Virgibacillus halodenitrificans]